ncbi:hypothetical protein [Persicitalea sp.]|uniref:type IV toxin-antitoxin system AbiEi family antitoxin domain-containing protein n=1 Tax=Persicitalea sp. TaxID=3100273 RepID=UPI003594631F
MDFSQAFQAFRGQPLTHQVLLSVLKDYKRPNDKIHELLSAGLLLPIRRGLYVAVAPHTPRPESFLLANHVYGPSYVSMDSALSYYGMIPERVYECSSATTKAARQFRTPAGTFSYTRLPLPYYAFGLVQKEIADQQVVMMASPEKALLDKVVTTVGLTLRSKSAASRYLLDNLQLDEDSLKGLDVSLMEEWLPEAPKKGSIAVILNVLKKL